MHCLGVKIVDTSSVIIYVVKIKMEGMEWVQNFVHVQRTCLMCFRPCEHTPAHLWNQLNASYVKAYAMVSEHDVTFPKNGTQ